jgi:hypothetical protein
LVQLLDVGVGEIRRSKRDKVPAPVISWTCESEWLPGRRIGTNRLAAIFSTPVTPSKRETASGLASPHNFSPEPALEQAGKELDKHYIPARYPNAYPEGAPYELYTREEAERAIAQAENILRFCEGHLS